MYLSRLILNPYSRQAQCETADPYNMHRTILKAFNSQRDHAGVLHRLDVNPRTGGIILLVQSQMAPDWSPLTEKEYLLPADSFSGLENPAVKQINLPLRVGQTLSFRLRANPTIKKVRRDENGNRRNSNRVPLVHEEKQLAWLQKRAEDNGFKLIDYRISRQQNHQSRKKENGRSITLYTIQFDGCLQITDTDKFKTAVRIGIGPAKVFGCGLLSLAPAAPS